MFIDRITSTGLAHHSYYIADGGEALVCDPGRDVDRYLELARRRGDNLRYVLETHRHEDFAVGSNGLAAVGAQVLHAASQDFGYGEGVSDGDRFELGRLRFSAMATTGHTEDSMCFAVADKPAGEAPFAVLTGDTLFMGDTGRVDLLGQDRAPDLARDLHGSLQRLLRLGDGVTLLPAHGPGSVCGAGISHRDVSSLGFERLTQSLLSVDESAFVQAKLAERHVRPPYFGLMEEWNLLGNAPVLLHLPQPRFLSPGELKARADRGVPVIDVRSPEAFAAGHVPRSYNIWAAGLASYLGWIVEPRAPVCLVPDASTPLEDLIRVAVRLGYDDISVLRGGFHAFRNAGERIDTLDTTDVFRLRARPNPHVLLDVRTPDEWQAGTSADGLHVFVGELEQRVDEIPTDRDLVTLCGVGNRAGLAASILKRHGFERVSNLLGGYQALREQA